MGDTAAKRCLSIIKLRADSNLQRIQTDIPKIVAFIRRFSKDQHELAFRSNDGLLFGFFLKVAIPQFLQAEFEKCEGIVTGDSFLVFEAGPLLAGIGFSRAWTWLERH